MTGKSAQGQRDFIYQAAGLLIFLATLALTRANVEAGMNDDWSFVRTTYDLAATGRLQYNGWSAPLIGFQALWGALFIKVFGFSFLAVRASSWILTLFTIPVLWRLLRSVELSPGQAFFGLLAFLLSPLSLPNLETFMTDMPAFMLFAAALLAALNAWDATEEQTSMRWVLVTTLLGILSGSIRQIYWLAAIIFLIVLAITRFRLRNTRILLAGCVTLTIAFGAICTRWLAKQPYVPMDTTLQAWHETAWIKSVQLSALYMAREVTGLAALSIPFSFLLCRIRKHRSRTWVGLLILVILLALLLRTANHMPWVGNTITNYGVTLSSTLSLGNKPEILSYDLTVLVAALGLAIAAFALWEAAQSLRELGRERVLNLLTASGLGRMAILTVPFLLTYLVVLAIRAPAFGLFDRYLIPGLFVVIALCLGSTARFQRRVDRVSVTTAAIFGLYAIATTHDYFADARAKLEATNRILAMGVPRDAVLSGFEYDLWTQVEKTGKINNKLVKYPLNAYQQTEDCNGEDDVDAWWRPMAPALKARYAISLSPFTSLKPAFALTYQRWLPAAKGHIYAGVVDESEAPLTCKPGSAE